MTEFEKKIRSEFPVLQNRETVYLDNGATSQKPQSVIDAVDRYYKYTNANPMRGLYDLSIEATETLEKARSTVAEFIHAPAVESIVFTRNQHFNSNENFEFGFNNVVFTGTGDGHEDPLHKGSYYVGNGNGYMGSAIQSGDFIVYVNLG